MRSLSRFGFSVIRSEWPRVGQSWVGPSRGCKLFGAPFEE